MCCPATVVEDSVAPSTSRADTSPGRLRGRPRREYLPCLFPRQTLIPVIINRKIQPRVVSMSASHSPASSRMFYQVSNDAAGLPPVDPPLAVFPADVLCPLVKRLHEWYGAEWKARALDAGAPLPLSHIAQYLIDNAVAGDKFHALLMIKILCTQTVLSVVSTMPHFPPSSGSEILYAIHPLDDKEKEQKFGPTEYRIRTMNKDILRKADFLAKNQGHRLVRLADFMVSAFDTQVCSEVGIPIEPSVSCMSSSSSFLSTLSKPLLSNPGPAPAIPSPLANDAGFLDKLHVAPVADTYNVKLLEQVHPPGFVNPGQEFIISSLGQSILTKVAQVPRGSESVPNVRTMPLAEAATTSGEEEEWRRRYDMVIIGAGAAGLVCASGCVRHGAKVALVEYNLMGGDCLNVGCVPSKSLLAAAKLAAKLKYASEYGLVVQAAGNNHGNVSSSVGGGIGFAGIGLNPAVAAGTNGSAVAINFPAVMERMRMHRADIAKNDSVQRFRDTLGVDVFFGKAAYIAKDTIFVEDVSSYDARSASGGHSVVRKHGRVLKFSKSCIATGGTAFVPPSIKGIETVPYFTNATIFNVRTLPPTLAVIGSGPVGCELAQAFARFGSKVTVFVRGTRILKSESAEVSLVMQHAMERDGVQFIFDSKIEEMGTNETAQGGGGSSSSSSTTTHSVEADEKEADNGSNVGAMPAAFGGMKQEYTPVMVVYAQKRVQKTKAFFAVLIAAGRKPNVAGLGLHHVGVDHDTTHGVFVNEHLQTTNADIYAAGDVCMNQKYTHVAGATGAMVYRNALFGGRQKYSEMLVPHVTFTDPEVASVGLTEQECDDKGIPVSVHTWSTQHNDRATVDGATKVPGFCSILCKKGTDEIVGATIVNEHAGEQIGELVVAMSAGFGLSKLGQTVHAYPCVAEIIAGSGWAYNGARMTPSTKALFAEYWKPGRFVTVSNSSGSGSSNSNNTNSQ